LDDSKHPGFLDTLLTVLNDPNKGPIVHRIIGCDQGIARLDESKYPGFLDSILHVVDNTESCGLDCVLKFSGFSWFMTHVEDREYCQKFLKIVKAATPQNKECLDRIFQQKDDKKFNQPDYVESVVKFLKAVTSGNRDFLFQIILKKEGKAAVLDAEWLDALLKVYNGNKSEFIKRVFSKLTTKMTNVIGKQTIGWLQSLENFNVHYDGATKFEEKTVIFNECIAEAK
jgi:hypothetical protein